MALYEAWHTQVRAGERLANSGPILVEETSRQLLTLFDDAQGNTWVVAMGEAMMLEHPEELRAFRVHLRKRRQEILEESARSRAGVPASASRSLPSTDDLFAMLTKKG